MPFASAVAAMSLIVALKVTVAVLVVALAVETMVCPV
jgi:hypothetical protein